MGSEIVALRQEVSALRREVRRKRRRAWLVPAACVVALLALLPAAIGAAGFVDLPNPDQGHNADINAIANAGVTRGCNPPANNAYCPYDFVTRQDMASFLARLGGLGGNPAVANAATVDGFYANGLVRANVGVNGSAVLLNGNYQNLALVGITLPGPGLIYVTGSTYLQAPLNGYEAVGVVRLIDSNTGAYSLPVFQDMGVSAGTSDIATMSATYVFLAATGGVRVYGLQGGVFSGIGSPRAADSTVSALYVPFGPGGAQAADLTGTPGDYQSPTPRP